MIINPNDSVYDNLFTALAEVQEKHAAVDAATQAVHDEMLVQTLARYGNSNMHESMMARVPASAAVEANRNGAVQGAIAGEQRAINVALAYGVATIVETQRRTNNLLVHTNKLVDALLDLQIKQAAIIEKLMEDRFSSTH